MNGSGWRQLLRNRIMMRGWKLDKPVGWFMPLPVAWGSVSDAGNRQSIKGPFGETTSLVIVSPRDSLCLKIYLPLVFLYTSR